MMRFIFSLVIVVNPFLGICSASDHQINAKLANYCFGEFEYNYFLLLPNNISDYTYLGHYPLTAFLFLKHYDEEKILQLTVNEIKSGSLGSSESCCAGNEYYDILRFNKIKGFEATAAKLADMDEFGITEHKGEIISTLLECYSRYKKDYKKYLRGIGGEYRIRKGKFGLLAEKRVDGYKSVKINERTNAFAFYERIPILDYDFDNKKITVRTLSPRSKISSNGWEYHYIVKTKIKHKSLRDKGKPNLHLKDFPDEVNTPLSLDDAKKLFADKDPVYCETIMTLVPESGFFGYEGAHFFVMTSNFSIKHIIKNYYKRKNWSAEEKKFEGPPVFTIELASNSEHPFN